MHISGNPPAHSRGRNNHPEQQHRLRYAVYNKHNALVDLVRIDDNRATSLLYSNSTNGFAQSLYFAGTQPRLDGSHCIQLICDRADHSHWQKLIKKGLSTPRARGPLRQPINAAQVDRISELHQNGMSVRRIADHLKLSKSVVGRVIKATH